MVAALLWVTPAEAFWLGSGIGDRALLLLGCVATGGAVYLAIMLLLGGRPAHLTHRA